MLRVFSFLFFSPFFDKIVSSKVEKKRDKKKRIIIIISIHSFIRRNSWQRASRAYTRSFERTPEASSGCNKARVFEVKKICFFFSVSLSLSLSRAREEEEEED